MNKIKQIFDSLDDAFLKECVIELNELRFTGVLKQGKVRELYDRVVAEVGVTAHDARAIVHNTVIRTAAHRWAGI